MDRLLFRAKAINRDGDYYRSDYKNGDWVYGLVTKLFDKKFERLPAEMVDIHGVHGIEVDHSTICQFTGLYNVSGDKIFDKDVVRFNDNLYEVARECDTPGGCWAETGYFLHGLDTSHRVAFEDTIDEWSNEICVEIIGTIFDYPEKIVR